MATEFSLASSDQESNAEPSARRFGRYWLLKLIARGGMGEVHLAATTGIEGAERPCVVKIIRREHAKDSSFLARFFDEARVQSQLQHPGVVQIFEASTDEKGEPFVVVEYVEGRSLGEVRTRALQLSYRLTWADAVAVATSTAEALVHVHERVDIRGNPLGIVHRDLSPQNVMLGYCGDVKLIDFGTARGQNRRCHTVSGVVFAKPGYVAPEVANGNTGDTRVDLYALGVMLWELSAGRRFLQGDPAEHLAAVAKNRRPLPPIAQLVTAPPQLDEVIAKLTAHELDKRYASARAALKDLVALLSKAPSLSNGERGVRARIAQFMSTIYPAEPTRSRREFARLVAGARVKEQEADPKDAAVEPSEPSPPVDDSLLPGTRYKILRKIGEGGIGAVFEAAHVDLDRRVALKVVSGEPAISSDFAARFRREARALSRLSHPNLVALHDFGQAADGRLFCAMEMLEGETLDKLIEREAPVSWQRALEIGLQAAQALIVAHQAGLVHRDLKPSNLFLCADGTLKLLDFGLAKTPEETAEACDEKDKSSFALYGTPEYMAPEQVGAGKVDARADLYALGCVLYELCTGRRPFVYDTSVRVLDAKLTREVESPRSTAPGLDLPVEVEQLILHSLARQVAARTSSAAELLEQMSHALRAPEIRRQRRRRAGVLAASAVVLIALFVLTGGLARRHPALIRSAMASVLPAVPERVSEGSDHKPPPAPVAVVESKANNDDALDWGESTPCSSVAETVSTLQQAAVAPSAAVQESDPEVELRDRAQKAVLVRNWPLAVDAARTWVRQAPSRRSRLFLARVLVHTHECRQATEVLAPELAEQPRSAEVKAVLGLCKDVPAENEKQPPPQRPKDRSKLARIDRPQQ